MKIPEGLQFECGKCAWMKKVDPPKGEKFDKVRGYCTFNPPAVFPMPQQTSRLKNLAGEKQVGVLPLMLRPIVEEDEPPCGKYAPDNATLALLREAEEASGKDKCGGCTVEGAKCEC